MKHLRYQGSFLSKAGVVWDVQIYQESSTPYATVGELEFPTDEPLVIEWADTGKEKTIVSSSATITIISPDDRRYIDLYTETPGNITVEVYCNDALYWCGSLDPEQYEEPYERAWGYDVTLTFQDFGLLDRINFRGAGLMTGQDILNDAITRLSLDMMAVDTSLVSTYHEIAGQNRRIALADFSFRADNFYDEDGEACTMEEVINGILTPLSLRIMQRGGKIWLYDINGLAYYSTPRAIDWSGDSQTLGVDRVFNNIRITFSPYASGKLMSPDEVKYTGEDDPDKVNLASNDPPSDGNYWSYFPDYGNTTLHDITRSSFTIHIGEGKGLAATHNYRLGDYFKIIAQGGGSDAEGVMWGFYTGGHEALKTGLPVKVGRDWNWNGITIMRTRRVYLGPCASADAARWMLRLKVEALFDMRYNPFTEPSVKNEEGNCKDAAEYINHFYVPCLIRLWDAEEGGSVLLTYNNRAVADQTGRLDDQVFMTETRGEWSSTPWSGAPDSIPSYLTWYDETTETGRDRRDTTGIQGWQGNRQCIGTREGYLSAELARIPDGQYIPYPTSGGWLDITIISGFKAFSPGSKGLGDETERLSELRWMLFKGPSLEVVGSGMSHELADSDDVEHLAWVNASAKEELSIDTICGTTERSIVTARGTIRDNVSGGELRYLRRMGRTLRPEQLLLGTLYSQFAERHTKLSGEAAIDNGGLCAFTERMQGETLFMMTGERQNCIDDTTEATLIEVSPDEYDMEIFEG